MKADKNQKKTALITGASSGIGNELSRLFAQDNYNLVLVSRNTDQLNQLAEELEEKYNIFVKIISKDLSKASAPEELFQETQREELHIDVLVNNAGFGIYGNFLDNNLIHELEMLQVNIVALTYLTKLYAKEMEKKGSGKILNVSSTAAFQPGPFMAVYYASKAYVLHFSEALSKEFKETGITVTTFCPGTTRTNFHERADIKVEGTMREKVMMKADEVARKGYDGLKDGKTLVVPGFRNKLLKIGVKFIPTVITTGIIKKFNRE